VRYIFTYPIISDASGEDEFNLLSHVSTRSSAAGKFAALKAEFAFAPPRNLRLT
jgi:hypothetical protein